MKLFPPLGAFALFVCCLLLFPFCRKEQYATDPSDRLEFSTDTLRFDTVFTQLGSATRILKVYNPHKETIRIARIYLGNGPASKFRLNVDGLPGARHDNIEIAPKDSLYVFAEVTIDPDQPLDASPFVIDEKIIFETNGNSQSVVLEAWGQNAVYLPSRFAAGTITGYGCNGGEWVWDDPRPYVIYGILAIDSCTVRIPAGTRVYVHGGLGKEVTDSTVTRYNDGFLAFFGNGKLLVEGTLEKPVIFESDRLEPEFNEEPGQWTGIWLQSGTRGHRIDHCIVRNSIIGVRVDSAADLRLTNSQIYNTASSGLIGIHADIIAENCLFYNNGGFSIQVEYGGTYDFTYCTVASYGVDGEALRLGNALCLDELCSIYRIFPLKATFQNCIFTGSRADQVTLFDREGMPALFQYEFRNCLVRVRDLIEPGGTPEFLNHCQPCLVVDNQDTIFVDPDRNNYHLDTLHSAANGYALPIPNLPLDLDGKLRHAVMPDAGAYENEF